MYTVIILNKRSSDLLGEHKFLFKPFVDEGLLGFCDWNEAGTDIRSSVPDLYNLVRGKKDWRAIIVTTDSVYDYKDSPVPHKNNPFDFSETDTDPMPHESPIPLIHLTHMIGGYNASMVKEFEKGFEYYDEEGQMHRIRAEELSMEEIADLTERYDDVKSVYLEKAVAPEVLAAQEKLVNQYQFSDARPVEIHMIATRKRPIDDDRIRVAESWKTHLEATSSAFWEKNKYPNNCRFLSYDITNTDNSRYPKELTEFWLSVLTLAINHIQAGTLQAYRLYRLDIEVSTEQLGEVLNNHLNKLVSAYGFVKEQLKLRPDYTFDEDEELVPRQVIPVALEAGDSRDLLMEPADIGLSRDCPQDEFQFWNDQVKEKKENFDKFLKAPRRSIDKSATMLKQRAQSYLGDYYELDPFQLDDLQEILDELEQKIISTDAKTVIDRKKLYENIAELDKQAKKEISYRLSKKLVLKSGLFAMGLCICGFIPYLISAAKLGPLTLAGCSILAAGVVALSAIGGIVALLLQRVKLVRLMKDFNTLMRNAANAVRAGAVKFEAYFTNICTYMKGQSILEGVRKRKSRFSSKSSLLCSHKLALRSAIERGESWLMAYGLQREDEMIPNVTVYFKSEIIPRQNQLYYFSPDHEEQEIPINHTGDTVIAPYKFIDRLIIDRVDIFDEVKGDE